jgi:hypothetical protein
MKGTEVEASLAIQFALHAAHQISPQVTKA